MNQNQANDKYFEILLDNSIVSKSDLDGSITYVNENFINTLGFSREEIMGKNHNILRHENTPNSIFKEMWKTIKSGQVFRDRVLSRKKDGSDFWAETTIIPLIDTQKNTIIEYIAIRRDITDFLYMQRSIQEQKVKEEEEKIISKAKDDFLVLFTHELKTPLNAIMNFSQYLLKNIGKTSIEKQSKLLTQIIYSSKNMLEDVIQLLELCKLKSNKLQYNLSVFSINEAIEEALSKHFALANEYKVNIINCMGEKQLFIKSDFYRFSQVIANILSNAIKYSNGKVILHTKEVKNDVQLIIEDNGVGVRDKEKIFELFEQDDDDMHTREKKGTGIGLSFVKFLCKDLKITYEIKDSEELGGLKFILKINARGEKND